MNLRGLLVVAACAASVLGIGTVGAAVIWPELTEYSGVAQSSARPEYQGQGWKEAGVRTSKD